MSRAVVEHPGNKPLLTKLIEVSEQLGYSEEAHRYQTMLNNLD